MRKTKIICTIGPASESVEILAKLSKAGMNIARLNFSHGTHEEHQKRIKNINIINEKLDVPIAILLDTQGPEIRLGQFAKPEILKDGQELTLTTQEVSCTDKLISISYKKISETIKPGNLIYIADGTIELKVKKVQETEVICEVLIGGEVNTKKNVSIPGAEIDLPAISNKDVLDIEFGAKNKIDFVAQSFVRSPQDVIDMKKLLRKNNSDAHVIAKIECAEGLKNIDEIINVSDGIMVARGDLGTQIPIERVPNAQKQIIKKCNCAGKPVIVATQMLESMIKNPRPTRAEATDVANAILDGTDAIMLSGETAAGKHPARCADTMNTIARETERHIGFSGLSVCHERMMINDAIARSVCQVAHDLNAAAIITCTLSGYTAKIISKYRPNKPIIAVTPGLREIKKLNLYWGVHPLYMENPKNSDELMKQSTAIARKIGFVKRGELVVITAGIPFGVPGKTNFLKVDLIV